MIEPMSSDTPFNHISQTHAPTNHTPTARFAPPHQRQPPPRGGSRPHPPTIDADLIDWPNALWLEIAPNLPHKSRGYSRLHTDSNEELATAVTADDLSAEFSLAYNHTAFYLAARVTVNVYDIEGGEEHQWYFKDTITLFRDIPSDGDGPGWIEGDHAFAFITDGSMWWRRGDRAGHIKSSAPKDTRMAMQKTTRGYTL